MGISKAKYRRLGAVLTAVAVGSASLFGVVHFAPAEHPGRAAISSAPIAPASPAPAKVTVAEPARPAIAATPPSAAVALDKAVHRLGDGFRGDVGIAVRDVQTGWTSDYRGLDYFPQQSVSKLWVAVSLFDRIDRGAADLSYPITMRGEDMTLFHQPIRTLALRPGGYHTTAEDLLVRALTQSDNSANDRLLRQVGGPEIVKATLSQKGLSGIRFGPGEALLQSRIAGLDWRPEYRIGNRFAEARAALPGQARRVAFDAYVADPIDGATPLGIADALARLKQGKLLSAASTDRLLSIMSHTKTGAQRLKGGLHGGWTLSHKTGTGQILDGEQAGYNDVGVLTAPSGEAYAISVLIGRTARPLPERMKLMQRVVAATIDYHEQLAAQRAAADRDEGSVVTGS